MNILFLSLIDFDSIEEHNIYTDLLRELKKRGNNIFVISPCERRTGKSTHIIEDKGVRILKLRIGNTQKTNIIEKGISTLMIEPQMVSGIKRYFKDIVFDLVLYTTPPITLYKAVRYVKHRDNARTYLMLKDIFPQNAVDLGMMSKNGLKGFIYRTFRRKEKKLYNISDKIGCMSPANVDYLLSHNKEISASKVEICPNSIEVIDKSVDVATRAEIRRKYNIPEDKIVFVYGGNLGKPQGIDFMIECLKHTSTNDRAYFLIVGDGTEYSKIEKFCLEDKPANVKLMKRIPKDDYDTLVGACDVGLIFLDYRFTIPNFPSRILGYMQAKLPVLAVTDANTDIGKVINEGEFGWSCHSNDIDSFISLISSICEKKDSERTQLGYYGYTYLAENFTVDLQSDILLRL